jgi:hypothetical protein
MAGQHHPQRGIGIFHDNHIAVQVGPNFIGKIGDIIANDLLQGVFIARRTGRFEKRFEKIPGIGLQDKILCRKR